MQFTKFEILIKTLELGSMTKVADKLGYTQSAISQMLNALEKQLGVTLLNRSHSGISLTAEGHQLLPYIQAINESHFNLEQQVMELKGLCSGVIRIGVFHSIACYKLPKLIKGFLELYPGVNFEIHEGDFSEIEEWLSKGVIDLGMLSIQFMKGFDTIPLLLDKLCVVLPPNHPMSSHVFYPLKDIEHEPFIYLDEGKDNDSQLIFDKVDIKPNITYTSKEDNTILSMVENNLGVAILPELVTSRTPFNVIIKDTNPCYFRTLGIAVKDKKKTSLATKKFTAYCKEHFQNVSSAMLNPY